MFCFSEDPFLFAWNFDIKDPHMQNKDIATSIKLPKARKSLFNIPAVTQISNISRSPFMVLISCILSLRTKDNTTMQASERLFNLARTPEDMKALSIKTIERAIYPVGFYINKAKVIKKICKDLVKNYNSNE